MQFFRKNKITDSKRPQRKRNRLLANTGFETLETRQLFAASPLPVLMVIADQHDFYYREYSDTRVSLETRGIPVSVAATSTATSYAHPNTGQTDGIGAVTPDIALSQVDVDNYSAIVFVGGWGSSMYQYAYNDPNLDGVTDNFYSHGAYNGDDNLNDGQIASTKIIVNHLINDFLVDDKPVAAICHGVTVLAWARVNGASPIHGRQVAVPTTVSAPDQFYEGEWKTGGYYTGQYDQIIDNGGIASSISGSIGNPATVADDVIVDGRIITAENYDSATHFGNVIAKEVLKSFAEQNGPIVVMGNQLLVHGTSQDDVIYAWTARGKFAFAWVNGTQSGPVALPEGGRIVIFGDDGNDQIFATDSAIPTWIYAGQGNDLVTGGSASDVIDGEEGIDRVSGGAGDDLLRGNDGNDYLYGQMGNDVLIGGADNDLLEGGAGDDLLIGGTGSDRIRGSEGIDILIGGQTTYDHNDSALLGLLAAWSAPTPFRTRIINLSNPLSSLRLIAGDTVNDDGHADLLAGGLDADWCFLGWSDSTINGDASDRLG